MVELAVIAGSVFGFALVSRRLRTTVLTAPMVFIAVGLATGDRGLDIARIGLEDAQVIALAEMTLTIVLFADAVRIDPATLRRYLGLPARLLGIGLPLTMAATTVGTQLLLDVGWARAALVGAILSATDAALGQAVLTEPSVPSRIRQTLNVESGLNDGLALPAVTLFTALAATESDDRSAGSWVRFVAEQIGFGVVVGVAVGVACGWALTKARRGDWADGLYAQLAGIAIAALAYAAAVGAGGNAFIAAFVSGLALRAVGGTDAEWLTEFAEDAGGLLAAITFLVFGSTLVGSALDELTVPIAVCALGTLTVARMAPVAVSLIGTGLRWPSVVFLGWFGPRGLASILFGLLVLEESGAELGDPVFTIVTWTVLGSVVAHGATASWAARRYGAWYDDRSGVEMARMGTDDPAAAMAEGPLPDEQEGPRVRWAAGGDG